MTGVTGLRINRGAHHRKKRVGCGPGSGHGKTSTRGHKGGKSRSGHQVKLGFEGGQNPLYRRIPKRGFRRPARVEYEIINLEDLKGMDPAVLVTPELLREKGLIDGGRPVKVLGDGALEKPLSIRVHAFSKSAADKVVRAGGKIEKIA